MSTVIYGKDSVTGSNDPVNLSDNKLHIAQYVWDTNTLSWIRQTGGSGGVGTEVSITNFPAVQPVSGTVTTTLPVYAKRYDQVDASTAYLGEADVGSAESSAVWRIQRLSFTVDGDLSVVFADANANFDNVWANRLSLSYS
jgi:hypothetical protein